ncbi:MAG: inositol monophosphatase family protein [Candidatus Sungbacteria bacterium]|nr:inositol monophosphatase family protein [Candidatus Sungbacteria bacterium]
MGTKIKNDGTPVTDLDNSTLTALRNQIHTYFPNDYTIGEEDQKSDGQIKEILERQNEYQWTIDGLDGTGNYRMGANSYGSMISRRRGNAILFSAIFLPIDEALRQNGFHYAEHGEGAWQWCGECQVFHKLSSAKEGSLERVVVMLEGSSKKFFKPPVSRLGTVVTTRPGLSSCAAAMAVARGRASAFVTVENKPWDNWPTWLLIQEAGGVVTDWRGNTCVPENCGNMVASGNRKDHDQILKLLS